MSEELERCPFCNSRAIHYSFNYRKHTVRCRGCLADCGEHDTPERAAFVWNTRPIEDEKDKQIAELKAELSRNANEGYVGFILGIEQMKKKLAEKDKVIARLKGNWDYLKEYLVALRNSRLHDECLMGSELNRYAISFLNGLIEKINATDNNVGSMK
jgi:hypothetical protein